MISIKIDGHVHGQYNVTIQCKKCKTAVFSGLSNDRDNVERVIRQRFSDVHTGCDAQWETESSAVEEFPQDSVLTNPA